VHVEKELEQFRQEAQRLRAGRAKGSGPFPEPLRAFAVRYLAQALEKGETLKSVVERLGVSEPTLQAWRRGLTVAELSLFLEGCEWAGRWKLSPPAFEEKELAVAPSV
jgi:hypothetical protein